jgi:hypothetical protein
MYTEFEWSSSLYRANELSGVVEWWSPYQKAWCPLSAVIHVYEAEEPRFYAAYLEAKNSVKHPVDLY